MPARLVARGEVAFNAARLAAELREQATPMQELIGVIACAIAGADVVGACLLSDALARVRGGEPMGGALEPLRSTVGRADARAGRPPEAPDVGYLSAYCEALIDLEQGR